jgi:4-hydroxy-2-oxoglutarate aldolase
MKLSGIFPAITTPFDHRGGLYIAKIRENISRWNSLPLAGFLVAGPGGEGFLLSAEERTLLWREAAAACDAQKLLLADVSSDGVRKSVAAANCAAGLGYKAAVIRVPCARLPEMASPATIDLFFRGVADQSSIPVILAVGRRTPESRLPIQAIAALASHPNIIGVIESSGDAASLAELSGRLPHAFPVLTGSALTLCPALQQGAAGAVLDVACAAPYFCLSIEEAVRTREFSAAEELQVRLSPAVTLIGKHGVGGLKCALDLQGYYGGIPRLPLTAVAPAARDSIAKALRGIGS